MNKQEKRLTWKYFWQQKSTEVTFTLLIVSAIILIPYLLGHHIGDGESTSCSGDFIKMVYEDSAFTSQNYWDLKECTKGDEWAEGILYTLAGGVSLFVSFYLLYLVFLLSSEWIESNWRKANQRAKVRMRKDRRFAKGRVSE